MAEPAQPTGAITPSTVPGTADTPPEPEEDRQISVRLPASLAQKLEDAAEERDVSKSRLVTRAVERYLDVLPPLESVLP